MNPELSNGNSEFGLKSTKSERDGPLPEPEGDGRPLAEAEGNGALEGVGDGAGVNLVVVVVQKRCYVAVVAVRVVDVIRVGVHSGLQRIPLSEPQRNSRSPFIGPQLRRFKFQDFISDVWLVAFPETKWNHLPSFAEPEGQSAFLQFVEDEPSIPVDSDALLNRTAFPEPEGKGLRSLGLL